MKAKSTPRGRPRAYDPDTALGRARDAFWRDGYVGTSLDALVAAMDMNRPSIYAAFGDKEALYAKAATRYAAKSRAALAQTLAAPGPLREVLRAVYSGAAAFYLAGEGGPRGCFLVGTALTEARRDRELRKLLETTFEGFTDLFAERFERAARAGELTPLPPRALAHIATAALTNLSLRARTGAKRKVIEGLIEATIDVICGAERGHSEPAVKLVKP